MDEPLFGEQKKQTQVSQIIVGVLVMLFTLFSIAVGVYFGIKNPRHFVLVGTLVVTFLSLALLVRWWRDKEDRIHPKFKYLIAFLVVCTILVGVCINTYVWVKPPPPLVCNGFYITNNNTCLSYPSECNGCLLVNIISAQPPINYEITCGDCTPPSSSSNATSSAAPQ